MVARRRRAAALAGAATAALALGAAPATHASAATVRACAYRNPQNGAVPFVEHVTTNLSARAGGPAGVCAVVDAAVSRTQALGFTLPRSPHPIDAGGRWTLDHRLVYPAGWPSPTGPVYDPHMHVTLRLVGGRTMVSQRASATAGAGSGSSGFWIRFDEYA